jgi:hypothetical protein
MILLGGAKPDDDFVDERRAKLAAEFGPTLADRFSQFIGAHCDRLNLSDADVEWGQRMMWTFGQVAVVTSAEQHDAYARQLADILATAGAPMASDAFAAFVRTPEGALAAALVTRIEAWKRTGH